MTSQSSLKPATRTEAQARRDIANKSNCDLCRLKFPRERRDGDRYVHLVDGGEKPCVGGKDFQ